MLKMDSGRKTAAKILGDLLVMLLMSAVVFLIFEGQSDSMKIWLSMLGPLMGAMLLLAVWGQCVSGNGAISRRIGLLLQLGLALQVRLLYPEYNADARSEAMTLAYMALLCVCAGVLMGPVLGRTLRTLARKRQLAGMNLALGAMYLVMLVCAGRRAGGLYVTFAGVTLACTLFAALPALVILGMTFGDTARSPGERLRWGLLSLAMDAVFFLLAGDLGTLLLLAITCAALAAVYLPRREAARFAGVLAGTAAAALVIGFACNGLYEAQGGEVPELVGRCARIYRKLLARVRVLAEPGGFSEGYQNLKMMEALAGAEILGIPYENVWIPLEGSDAAFAALIAQLGLLAGMFALVLTVGLFRHTSAAAAAAGGGTGGAGMAFSIYLTASAVVCALCNAGLIPMVGVPFALVSKSGSAMMLAMVMLGCLMWLAGTDRSGTEQDQVPGRTMVLWAVFAAAAVMAAARVLFAMIAG